MVGTRERKLSLEDREHLISQWQRGISQTDLASAFGVSQSSVSYLVRKYAGATPGRAVVRLVPGSTLRELRGRLENHLETLQELVKVTGQMLVLAGAVRSAPEEREADEAKHGGNQWKRAQDAAASGDLDNDGAIFNGYWVDFLGERMELGEFYRRFPKGLVADSERVYTRAEAEAARDEILSSDKALAARKKSRPMTDRRVEDNMNHDLDLDAESNDFYRWAEKQLG